MKRIGRISVLILLILSSAATILFSQEVRIKAEIDTSSIFTGDQIRFIVRMEKPAGLDISLYRFSDTIVKNIEIIRGPDRDTIPLENGLVTVSDSYLITSFDSGRYEIPPVYAEVTTESGLKRYYGDYIYLEVKRPDISPPDTTRQFFDIIGPYRAPVTAGEVLPWVLAAMAAALIAYYSFRYFRSRKRKEEHFDITEPVEAAHIIAYRNLEKLKSEKLWQKGLFKEYYSTLSDILRSYIDQRYGMNSMESTTGEIMNDIRNHNCTETEVSELLKQVLELSDLVKFARVIPEASDCELSMEQSWSFVSQTRKVRQPETSDDGEDGNSIVTVKEPETEKGGEV
jgi:hypothetical protein